MFAVLTTLAVASPAQTDGGSFDKRGPYDVAYKQCASSADCGATTSGFVRSPFNA